VFIAAVKYCLDSGVIRQICKIAWMYFPNLLMHLGDTFRHLTLKPRLPFFLALVLMMYFPHFPLVKLRNVCLKPGIIYLPPAKEFMEGEEGGTVANNVAP
jgi:hypothetical protein